MAAFFSTPCYLFCRYLFRLFVMALVSEQPRFQVTEPKFAWNLEKIVNFLDPSSRTIRRPKEFEFPKKQFDILEKILTELNKYDITWTQWKAVYKVVGVFKKLTGDPKEHKFLEAEGKVPGDRTKMKLNSPMPPLMRLIHELNDIYFSKSLPPIMEQKLKAILISIEKDEQKVSLLKETLNLVFHVACRVLEKTPGVEELIAHGSLIEQKSSAKAIESFDKVLTNAKNKCIDRETYIKLRSLKYWTKAVIGSKLLSTSSPLLPKVSDYTFLAFTNLFTSLSLIASLLRKLYANQADSNIFRTPDT